MNKLFLIVQREYVSRVTKPTFILTTILTPVAIAVLMTVMIFISMSGKEQYRVVLKDDTGLIRDLSEQSGVVFERSSEPLDSLKAGFRVAGFDGVLYFGTADNPDWNERLVLSYYSDKQLGIEAKSAMEDWVAKQVREAKIDSAGYQREVLERLKTEVQIRAISTRQGEEGKSASVELATILGMVMGFIMYVVLFIYGSMVMRSVMEEKVSRVVEVIVSSVRPFELMLGKVMGVALVGLTQFVIWIVLTMVLQLVIGLVFAEQLMGMQAAVGAQGVDAAMVEQAAGNKAGALLQQLSQYNFPKLIALFVFYFVGGYLLYASLFAAVGSAIGDDISEGQSLTLPVTIPVVIAIYIMMAVVRNPNSSMASWASWVPFFSPIVMPARLAFNPPWWEIVLSMVLLVAACMFFIWLSARIYRVGILMYGKKTGFKELAKWIVARD